MIPKVYARIILGLGLWVTIIPLLGLPFGIKKILLVLGGATLLIVAIFLFYTRETQPKTNDPYYPRTYRDGPDSSLDPKFPRGK